MKPGLFSGTHSHGDLHSLDVIEDRCGLRRKHGLPARYSKGRFLGKGGFAKCYEVQDMETKGVFAAKIVAKASISKPRAHAKLRSEIAIHRSLDHDKVVKFYDYFEDNEYVYIILELCPCQTLNEFMRKRPSKRLAEPEAMFYVYDLIVALKYLHRRRVIHRDLKLGNLFLDADVRLKVGDFGLAAQLEHDGEKKRTICGTPNYIAPEILEGKHGHSFEVDIWSLGVILYTMIIGRPPFETSDVKTTYRRIRYNQYNFPDTVRISDPAKDLIASILRTDPRSRPSLDEILASTWFASAQRLPPPLPVTISAFAVSPRVANGNSSARSETPERGAADFARIDSPVPRFPLRDRSPSNVPAHQTPTQPQQPPGRQQSVAPLMPNKQPPATPSYGGATTPGRYPPGGFPNGRPPLAHRGNEENVMPNANMTNVNPCGSCEGVAYATPMSPSASQALLGGTVRCRPQSAHLSPSGSTGYIGPSYAPPQAGTPVPTQSSMPRGTAMAHPAARDVSPTPSAAGGLPGAQISGKMTVGYCSARSATCSPRQPAATLSSARLATGMSTPKEGQNRSARGFGCSGAEGAAHGHNIVTKMNPAVLRNVPPLSSRGPGALEGSDHSAAQPPAMQHHFMSGGSVADITGGRTPLVAPPSPQLYDRKPLSARQNERSSSSPALLFDGPQQEPLTPAAYNPDGSASRGKLAMDSITRVDSARFGSGFRSVRCTTARSETGGSGMYAPASSSRQSPSPGPRAAQGPPELWVTKFVDYSSKYGVGYILSDGSIGVYFNDSTKIVMVPEGNQFSYVTRRTQEKPELRSTHTFEDYPEDLKKKVTLLRHFKNYMLTDVLEKKDGATVGESSLPLPQPGLQMTCEAAQVPYVKKWTRNKHAIMFQLSNKIVQVIFFDKTEAVLSSKSHTVTYVDKKSQVCSYPLSNVLDVPSAELAKRLRYTKDILVNLLGARTNELGVAH